MCSRLHGSINLLTWLRSLKAIIAGVRLWLVGAVKQPIPISPSYAPLFRNISLNFLKRFHSDHVPHHSAGFRYAQSTTKY